MIKVADFGLSVSMADEKNYFRSDKESEKLPVKWMAPESLLDRKFSELSDVVSLGCTRKRKTTTIDVAVDDVSSPK